MATREIADILLIGSGATGGPFAWHLSQMPGIKIVCLEQGDWVAKPAPEQSSEVAAERRRLAMPPRQKGVQRFANGYPYDYTESDWQPLMHNAVGGASVHWSAFWTRMHPSDFLARSLEGVADDWGITYWDLHPYYDMIERWVGISGVPGNPAYPKRDVEFMPPPRLASSAEILSRGFKKLGWHWWPVERAVITRPFKGRKPCETFCAACDHGCPREAKNSTDVTFWPYAIKNGVILKTRARVREITVNKQGLATGALYYDADGRLDQQKARIVVVACNGFGTPRLLLNSKSNRFPHGLANSSGLVGKCLMGHPGAGATGLFDMESAGSDVRSEIVDGRSRVVADEPLNGICSHQHYEPDPKRGFAQGFFWLSAGTSGPLGVALGVPALPLDTRPPADQRYTVRAVPVRWGAAHHAEFQERFSRQVMASASCSELPEEVNRVELHPTLTDEFGIPAVKVIHRLGENTLTMMDCIIERAKELLDAAGASKIVSTRKGGAGAHHLMGTARMGKDPRRSVVDTWGRAHDVKNLFIIDGSVFTTGAACLPTATMMAVALRTADYFKNNSRNLLT